MVRLKGAGQRFRLQYVWNSGLYVRTKVERLAAYKSLAIFRLLLALTTQKPASFRFKRILFFITSAEHSKNPPFF
jgi:hypothetical protein